MAEKNQLINLIQTQQWPHATILDSDDQEILAKISTELIQILVCPQHSHPTDQCQICQHYFKGVSTNFLQLKSGIQQLKKEELLLAIQQLSLFSLEPNQLKILLIDGGENLSRVTGNSLLKFLEEPPQNTFIIILSQNYSQMMATIRSRCQRFHLTNNRKKYESSLLEKIITTDNHQEFVNWSYQWSNLAKEELISDLNNAYQNLIIVSYPQLAYATLSLIEELKNWSFDRLALANYLIVLEALVGKSYENL